MGNAETTRSVLIVDDEAMIGEMIATILGAEGFQTQVFRDPKQALEAVRSAEKTPDLLLTDFAMGELNGLELIRRCRELRPGLKAMLMSGTIHEDELAQQPVRLDAFLAKPFQTEMLIFTVRKIVN